MIVEKNDNGITLYEAEHFSARDILTCGQVFRYNDNISHWSVISLDKKCDIVEDATKVRLITDDSDYFVRYFDLDNSYTTIIDRLRGLPFMDEAIPHGKGIRILNQDKAEMVISFIISSNNQIPRIKAIIDKICTHLGEKKGDYYAFPTIEALAGAGETFYRSIGAGFRAKYLDSTANALLADFDLHAIDEMDSMTANKALCGLMGVGPKVADCILLFGYHRMDVFPVDTWIKKVYKDIFHIEGKSNSAMRRELIEMYGEISGYAQQYLFYNKRG